MRTDVSLATLIRRMDVRIRAADRAVRSGRMTTADYIPHVAGLARDRGALLRKAGRVD